MGRVSRYKKIKASDPFYKGPRKPQQRSRAVNQRPENEDDQPVPKSLVRLMRSVEEMKSRGTKGKKGTGSDPTAAAARPHQSTSGETLTAGSRVKGEEVGKEGPMFERRRGETVRAYFDRIDVEANARIMESYRTSRKKSDRKKRYLEERKKKFKSRKMRQKGEEWEEVEEEEEEKTIKKSPLDFTDLKDEVCFGEVASAPPRLNARPRGSQERTTKGKTLLLHKLTNTQPAGASSREPKVATKLVGLKRKQDLEEERERAVEGYRQSKKARLARTKDRTLTL